MKKLLVGLMTVVLALTLTVNTIASETILTRENIPVLREDSAEASGLVKLGILKGTGESLALDRDITRAEAVALVIRMVPVYNAYMVESNAFADMQGHWAQSEVTYAKSMGLVDGTSETTFDPDRNVTGKEFAKILLSLLGYDGITIENAYEKGIESELSQNNFTKSVVYSNEQLLRGDAVRLCFSALCAKSADDGTMYYKKLIKSGKYKEEDFIGVLYAVCEGPYIGNFTDKMNAMMPENENYMFSPLSIKMAFAMAANGASGDSLSQIMTALEIDDLDEYNNHAKSLIEQYSKTDFLKINIANSIWLNKDQLSLNFASDYKNILAQYYNADAYSYGNDTIVDEVNKWVSEKTNNKITSIVDKPDFWSMIVNAIYFKGGWEIEFSEILTKKDKFTDRNGVVSEIDFMNQTSDIRYYNASDMEIVELPYKRSSYNEETRTVINSGLNISMYLVKGDYRDKELTEIIKNGELKPTYMNLSLPKFRIEYDTSIKGHMKNLGITDVFDMSKADLTKMYDGKLAGNDRMFITDAFHKTYIDVDEKGTEAAAVTYLPMAGTGMPQPKPEPITVKYDEPFTFVIRDNTNGEVLFIGEYAFA